MINKKSSEEMFDIAKQPPIICPDIDGLLNSIKNIGEEDEDGEIIEVDPDWGSWDNAFCGVEELKYWQESWMEIGDNLLDRLNSIEKSIKKYYDDEPLTSEQEMYVKVFEQKYDDVIIAIEDVESTLKDWKKELNYQFKELEWTFFSVQSLVGNNDYNSADIIEEFRDLVAGFRSLGNENKPIIRDNAQAFTPELCNLKPIEDIYDEIIENEDKVLSFIEEKEKEITPEETVKNKKTNKFKI